MRIGGGGAQVAADLALAAQEEIIGCSADHELPRQLVRHAQAHWCGNSTNTDAPPGNAYRIWVLGLHAAGCALARGTIALRADIMHVSR